MNIKSIVFTIFVFLVIAGALLYYFLATPSFVVKEGPPKVIAVLIASDLQLSSVEGVKAGLKELNYQIDKDVIIKLNNPKYYWILCTRNRTFVMINGIPVCTWSKVAWENFIKNDTYGKTLIYTVQ